MSSIYDVAVIGAGISGLWTAKQLQDMDLSVVVIESSSRVGGRIFSKQMPDGTVVEFGGTYFNNSYVRLKELISHYDLAIISKDQVNTSHSLFFDVSSGQRIKFGQSSFRFRCVFASLDFNHFLRRLDQLAFQIPLQCPWQAANALALDSSTVADFIDQEISNHQARRTARFFVTLNTCAQPEEVSLLWFLWTVKQCGTSRNMIGSMKTGSEQKLALGMQEICERLASELNEDSLRLNNPVVGCDYTANSVILRLTDFSLIKAKKVIFATPLAILAKIHFSPSLSATLNQAPYKLPMGACIRFIVHYDRPFWNDKQFSGHLMINSSDCYMLTYDDSRNASFGMTGFLIGDCARAKASLTSDDRQKWILNQLATALQDDRFLTPSSYQEHNWMEDQYIGGGYNSYACPGYLTRYQSQMKQMDSIFFAGSDFSPIMSNSIEGALLAAEVAVQQVAKALKKKPPKPLNYSTDVSTTVASQSVLQRWAPSSIGLIKLTAVAAAISTISLRHLILSNK